MFPKDTEDPHKMAVLKRSNILVSAGKCFLFRRFTQEETRFHVSAWVLLLSF